MSDVILNHGTLARIRAMMAQAGVLEADLREQFVLGSGSGGQKRNKTSSCVRLSHPPSAMEVRCEATRSREANRWLARRLLAQRLLEKSNAAASERQQRAERIRRQKRRRSRRQQARIVEGKRQHGECKRLRSKVSPDASEA